MYVELACQGVHKNNGAQFVDSCLIYVAKRMNEKLN